MLTRLFNRLLQALLLALIHLYRITLSPLIGNQCRYQPTCSAYGLGAIRHWGPWRGTWMTVKRIARCHPWSEGGFDPVPLKDQPPAKSPKPEFDLQTPADGNP